ncbi:MAG: class I SAM-dependent methyltransferase [Chloroflexota bacterium]|nr:class I SAM-dependent methyltransferase [Chloroflexota bacterium]
MDTNTVKKLIRLNQQFYQTFAFQFAETRQRLQPGVIKMLEMLPSQAKILDLGCGNGELARQLSQREHQAAYIGLDFSLELLDVARERIPKSPHISFAPADLSDRDWPSTIGLQPSSFDIVLAFATFHHLPSRELHRQTLTNIHSLLTPGGSLIHSNWQFLNSPRLRVRVQPWGTIGLTSAKVDPGDYLLDWRRGGYGLRYVHHFDEEELHSLAAETGFEIIDSFCSDGKEGNLGLYQIWEKKA